MNGPRIPVAKPDIGPEEIEAATTVLRSGWLTQGPRAVEFENALSEYLGAKHTYCVSSCTTGLFLALKSAGIGPGDEVIVPTYSFIATANSVVHAGATPVFADIEPGGLNLDIRSVASAISSRTKAILLVHQVGVPADIEAFQRLASSHGITVIEDAACAIGSTYRGRKIGSHSDWVVFSFHPRKILTTGEGGAVCYNGDKAEVRTFLNIARKHGMDVNDLDRHLSSRPVQETYPIVGYNFRMTDIQAAIGLAQLTKLERGIAQRGQIAERYNRAFGTARGIALPVLPDFGTINHQTYLIGVESGARVDSAELIARLLEHGIATRRGIPCAHREPCYSNRPETTPVSLNHSEHASQTRVVLPLYASMTEAEVDTVIEAVVSIC